MPSALLTLVGRAPLLSMSFLCVLLMMAFVVSGNGEPLWWSGLVPTLVLGSAAVAMQLPGGAAGSSLSRDLMLVPVLLTVGCVVSLASLALTDPTLDGAVLWASAYLSPVVVFTAVFACRLDERRAGQLVAVMALAAAVPLLRGLVEFYRAWGVPTGVEYLFARYDLQRMSGYMRATFGNTGNTAAYLSLVVPLCASACLRDAPSAWQRWIFRIVLTAAALNVLIVQSRTLFFVLVPSLLAVMYVHRTRFRRALSALVVAAVATALPAFAALDQALELVVGVADGAGSDQSAFERMEAIGYGWRLLLDHPGLGVGPGRSLGLNPYASAHQFWVQQGAEIGVFGLVWSVLLTVTVFIATWRVARQARGRARGSWQFTCIIGAATFLLYGAMANMALAESVVNAWVGMMAALLAVAATGAPNESALKLRGKASV